MSASKEGSLAKIESDLSSQLRDRQHDAIETASRLLDKELSIHSFHAIIGCRNNDFVDAVRTQFSDPDDFWRRWLHGFRIKLQSDRQKDIERYGHINRAKSVYRLKKILDDDGILEYTRLFLVRNFYRHLRERTRAKPDEKLWEIWFGLNQSPWGLIISPAHRGGIWSNDKSEIRRAKYEYWTIGHVVEEGLATPDSTKPYPLRDPVGVIDFYLSVLGRSSVSKHEREVSTRYVNYLRESDDILAEPFLIPEMRFAGLNVKHLHRLDFTILNSHTMQFIGVELSPHATHGAVKGMKSKTQKAVNEEARTVWEKEMATRNDYHAEFGLSTLTFTDSKLQDPDAVFDCLKPYLKARPEQKASADAEILAIRNTQI